jgi:tetratricopeptide (TPR) repeat protein
MSAKSPPSESASSAVEHAIVSAAFAEALAAPPAARPALVRALARTNERCARELERWLSASERLGIDGAVPESTSGSDEAAAIDDGFLDRPMLALDRVLAGAERLAPALPASIGPYRVLASIGHGTFARVYLAEQRSPRRRVAIKLLAGDLGGRDIVARFDRERHALARLQHPSIACLHEVGLEGDAPYFVMEWVDGKPITDFAVAEGLNAAERLRLFLQLARAVQHAHERGVIHRDLKPSNILAYRSEGGPGVKVIDFGVSKAIQGGPDESLGDHTLHTVAGTLVGTPPYMSPELLDGEADRADGRCDIYALGAILFELLVGRKLVHQPKGSIADYRRLARQRPEVRLPNDPAIVPAAWRRDLEAVIETAASPEVDRRYASAADLCADLERILVGEPVRARSISVGERAQRLVRAHPLASGLFVGCVLAAAAFAIPLLATRPNSALRARLTQSVQAAIGSAEQLSDRSGVEEERMALQRSALVNARELIELGATDVSSLQLLARALRGVQEAEAALAERTASPERDSHLAEADRLRGELLAVRRQLADRPDASIEDRAEFAVALVLIGNGREAVGEFDAARVLYEQSLAIEEELHREAPDHPLVLSRLCYSCERLGVLASGRGEWAVERAYNRRRVGLAERLLALRPHDRYARLNMAEARRLLLRLDSPVGVRLGPLPDGDELCRLNILHCRALAADQPSCKRSQRELALGLETAVTRMRDPAQGRKRIHLLTEAASILRRTLADQPDDPYLLDPLARFANAIAQEYERLGDRDQAIEWTRQQREMLALLRDTCPNVPSYGDAFGACEVRIAMLEAEEMP